MRRRWLIVAALVGIAALTLPSAFGYFSDSGQIEYSITAGDFGGPDEGTGDVWVCKVVGHPDDPRLKPGENPIRVSSHSLDAEEAFSDAHPSYVVESGDVQCRLDTSDGVDTPADTTAPPEGVAPDETVAPPDTGPPPGDEPPATTDPIQDGSNQREIPGPGVTVPTEEDDQADPPDEGSA